VGEVPRNRNREQVLVLIVRNAFPLFFREEKLSKRELRWRDTAVKSLVSQ
jgi:P pilus assembly chaperone PapD